MSRWYEHPCSGKLLEGDQVLNVLTYLNEGKECFKKQYGDINSKFSPLEEIIKMWPDKSGVKKEWLRKVIDNGPMKDKMECMVSVITQFPMHSFYYLDHLISLVNFNKKRFATEASKMLVDLFVKALLPPLRPLLNMKERPLKSLIDIDNEKAKKKLKGGILPREKILTYWYYEEQLKTRYIRFIKALEEMMKGETDKANKLKMISFFYKMCNKKESQSLMIEVLINKLGDNDRKVVGSALSKLRDLEKEHKTITPMIVRGVRKFVFRPHLSTTAQYYAIQLLVAIKFDPNHLESAPMEAEDDTEIKEMTLPVEVIQVYIGVLKRLMDASKTKCEKLYSALMCGISRAIPYAKGTEIKKYTDSIFKLVHSCNINLSIQGLKVLFAIVSTKQGSGAEDSQANMDRYQRLVYRTLTNPSIFFNSQKTKLIEIFFKSVAIDDDINRAKTMVKRLLQLCIQMSDPGFICVCLLFLSKLTKSKLSGIFKIKVIKNASTETVKVPTVGKNAETDTQDMDCHSEDEIIPDIVSDDEEPEEKQKPDTPASSWVHSENIKLNNKTVYYDAFAVDPKFANADREELVELTMLKNHTHPTVKLFVEKILQMEPIVYKSDPSEDFSLAKFLDRFAFRNPKETMDKRKLMPGSSQMVSDPARKMAVNSKQFADLSEANVPIDELFFYKYFNHSKKNTDEVDEEFDDSDTEFDALLGKTENGSDDDDNLSLTNSEMGSLDEFDDDDSDLNEDDDEEDFGAMEMEGEGAEEDEEEDELMEVDEDEESSEEEGATIHSSKRRKLGNELSSITTGAMASGNAFEAVQRKYESKRKEDRKIRKGKKEKKVKKTEFKPKDKKVKGGKKKFKK